MTMRTYASPEAFKQALEQRLRTSAKTGAQFARRRQLLVFERFLARIAAVLGDAATLKGGLVLELRLDRARTTKDVDLRVLGSPDDLLAKLQETARRELGDFMTFEVGPDEDTPAILNDGTQYEGRRFRAECRLAGKLYGQPFGVDVAFGDPILGEPEVVVAEDVLAFAGIAPPTLRLYPIETHIAEKLHAYTIDLRVSQDPPGAGAAACASARLGRRLSQRQVPGASPHSAASHRSETTTVRPLWTSRMRSSRRFCGRATRTRADDCVPASCASGSASIGKSKRAVVVSSPTAVSLKRPR
ncbi:MAG: nucleotidyl transferase AbiEii/AbiGii toxin family protein [Deltaproteobacteria bacterium]|nr:nucleotidyl transferase AbiEii/AbiGii toxin family protein [Deltaproteobacteria bacterium]